MACHDSQTDLLDAPLLQFIAIKCGMNYKDIMTMIGCDLSNVSSACSIAALTVQGKKILVCSKNRLCKTTENNMLYSNNENPQIEATSSVHEALFKMSTWIFSARGFASLNHTFNAGIISFRSWSHKTVLICCSRTGTDWYFHGICSGTHWKVITKIICKSIKLILHSLLSHCVVYNNASKEIGQAIPMTI